MGAPRRLALLLVGLVAAVGLGRAEVAEPIRVSSDSMAPTLARGDHVILDKLSPQLGTLSRGDLITFRSPQDDALILKRVVGLAGDIVELRDAQLYVNDRPVLEPNVDLARIDGTYFGPVLVKPNQVFVMGDNRSDSIDSRVYGGVPVERITGRVLRFTEPQYRHQ